MTLIIALLLFSEIAMAGPIALGICYTGCNAVWVACVTAGGGIAGVTTGGSGVSAAIKACSAAQGVCMTACVAAFSQNGPWKGKK